MSKLIKRVYSNVGVKFSMIMHPVFFLKSVIFNIHTWEAIAPSPYTSSPAKANSFHPSQTSFEQRRELTFNRRLPNITYPVVQVYIVPPLKIW